MARSGQPLQRGNSIELYINSFRIYTPQHKWKKYQKSFTFQKGLQQLHSHVGYKTKYHLLLAQHSGTTNMGAEVHIQNRLIDPPPDYLLRRQQQLFNKESGTLTSSPLNIPV